jgi:hypothetical protein
MGNLQERLLEIEERLKFLTDNEIEEQKKFKELNDRLKALKVQVEALDDKELLSAGEMIRGLKGNQELLDLIESYNTPLVNQITEIKDPLIKVKNGKESELRQSKILGDLWQATYYQRMREEVGFFLKNHKIIRFFIIVALSWVIFGYQITGMPLIDIVKWLTK